MPTCITLSVQCNHNADSDIYTNGAQPWDVSSVHNGGHLIKLMNIKVHLNLTSTCCHRCMVCKEDNH